MLRLQRRQVKESRKDSPGLVAVLGCDGPSGASQVVLVIKNSSANSGDARDPDSIPG